MYKKYLLSFFIFFALVSQSSAESWVFLGESNLGKNGVFQFYDKDSVIKIANSRLISMRGLDVLDFFPYLKDKKEPKLEKYVKSRLIDGYIPPRANVPPDLKIENHIITSLEGISNLNLAEEISRSVFEINCKKETFRLIISKIKLNGEFKIIIPEKIEWADIPNKESIGPIKSAANLVCSE